MGTLFNRQLLKHSIAALALCLLPAVTRAADAPADQPEAPRGTNWFVAGPGPSQPIPPEAKNVTVKEHLNSELPLDLTFTDENGKAVQLKQFFTGKKPVILQLGYYKCPMLCSLISRGLVESLQDVKLNAGNDFEVVFVSIDPSEKPDLAHDKKQTYIETYNRPGTENGWHLLTGKQDQIAKLADAVGFEYRWIASAGQYSHPAVLVLATPEGRVSRYLYGVKFDPETLRLSLVEASDGKIGTTVDAFILTCFQFDGHQGKYALAAIRLMKIGGGLTMLIVGSGLFYLFRRERRLAKEHEDFPGEAEPSAGHA